MNLGLINGLNINFVQVNLDAFIIIIVVKLFGQFSVISAVQVDEDDRPDVVRRKYSPYS